jgi:predicted dinucleotide-binding enzyme
MKIGILGTGRMGSTLGKLWASKGHEVFFGSRDPEKAQAFVSSIGGKFKSGSLAESTGFGDAILLASIWIGVEDVINACGSFENKVLIDCTIPMEDKQLAVVGNTSGAEIIAGLAPGARVVKAFNTIYYEHFERPSIDSRNVSMFYCGDDPDAKSIVAQLGSELGLDAVDAGPLFNARALEAMGFLWIYMAFGCGYGLEIGYKLLREQ